MNLILFAVAVTMLPHSSELARLTLIFAKVQLPFLSSFISGQRQQSYNSPSVTYVKCSLGKWECLPWLWTPLTNLLVQLVTQTCLLLL